MNATVKDVMSTHVIGIEARSDVLSVYSRPTQRSGTRSPRT
jgi:hypothetical protein